MFDKKNKIPEEKKSPTSGKLKKGLKKKGKKSGGAAIEAFNERDFKKSFHEICAQAGEGKSYDERQILK